MKKWIKVTEELPPHDTPIILYDNNVVQNVLFSLFEDEDECGNLFRYWLATDVASVEIKPCQFWQELPLPPINGEYK